MNIGSTLTQAAAAHPDHIAIIHGDKTLSYRAFNERANRLASQFRALGIRPGDRVGILQRNGPELLETLFATFKAGAVAVPINARSHPKEYAYILENSGCSAVVFQEDFVAGLDTVRHALPDLCIFIAIGAASTWSTPYENLVASGDPADADVDCAPHDLAWLFYTSGTTGKPKGAMNCHANLQFMSDHYPREVYQLGPHDVVLHPGPLTHGSGLWSIPITAGAGTHLIPSGTSFDPDEIFRLIEKHRVTKIAFIAPTMITMLLNAPTIDRHDLSSLRFLGYGGAPMYVEDLKRAIQQWGPILCQVYGQGESPMTISLLKREDHKLPGDPAAERRLASAGRVREDIELAILDEADHEVPEGEIGEIAIRGEIVMRGYWNMPEATAEVFKGGWYHSGDLGMRDADGYVFLLDRKKEMIISGGANVYPRELEEVFLLHPGVLEVAVIGIPDRLWGESVMAVVRPRPGASPTEGELLTLCREHLAGYKKPRFIRYQDDLPKNSYGKILKRELKQSILAEIPKVAT
ncbi:class I adenylate-forming enzyme family protein [Paraburkholderia sediminicola]|uniref:class I adenylate-forming enzyme family protein n=1 Tax=Paraburkholderia sediminicola TaxID=458836 RepID=UPI0038BC28C6